MANKDFPASPRAKRLIKIASISLVALLVLLLGGLALLRSYIRPPVISDATAGPAPTTAPLATDMPFVAPEPGVNMPHLSPTEGRERKPHFFTFLIFGLDDTMNADSIMVAAYDGVAQEMYLISIPRDTHVDTDRWLRKIVSAYPTGLFYGDGHADGVENLMRDVQGLIGFRPDFYISIEKEALVHVIDAVGGVELYVPFHMYYDDPCQDLHINIPAGLQRLDGENAAHFASYRLGNNPRDSITDYRRIKHQHQLLTALFQELLTPHTLLRIPDLIRTYRNYVGSNLSLGEQLWFGAQVYRMGEKALLTYTLPILGTSGAPYWFELPNGAAILELVNRTVNPFTRDITADMLRIAPQ